MTTVRDANVSISLDRPHGMPDSEWESSVDNLARAWLRVSGLNADLDLVSVEAVKDAAAALRAPSLYEDRTPYQVVVTYRGGRGSDFRVEVVANLSEPEVEPRPRWDLVLIGCAVVLFGGVLRHVAEGEWWDVTITVFVALLLLTRARTPAAPR